MNIENIKKVLLECYSKDLCYPKVQDDWNENNKCLGMCAITSLIINDYFGGNICKIHVDNISHYFNLIENKVLDLTSSQFNHKIDYKDYQIIDREKILTDDTKNRYNILKTKLIKKLLKQVDEKVYSCKYCDKLVDKFPKDATVFIGRDNDIVLVGEAPANNGWRKSHKLWCDINGKVLPSGVVLQKLFKYFYDKAPDLLFVAYDNDKPVGVIMTLLKPWWDGMHLEDGEVFVCEEYKKQGIAKRLFKTLFTYAIEKYNATVLEAHTYEDENGFPYCWYKRLGFETIDDWKIISGNIKQIVHKL